MKRLFERRSRQKTCGRSCPPQAVNCTLSTSISPVPTSEKSNVRLRRTSRLLQLAESRLTRRLFGQILGRIARLAAPRLITTPRRDGDEECVAIRQGE